MFSFLLFCKLFATCSYAFKLVGDINILKKFKYILWIGLSVYSDLRTYITAYITYQFNYSSVKQLKYSPNNDKMFKKSYRLAHLRTSLLYLKLG